MLTLIGIIKKILLSLIYNTALNTELGKNPPNTWPLTLVSKAPYKRYANNHMHERESLSTALAHYAER